MNDVRTALCREAQGRLSALVPMWPTSTCTSFSEAPQKAHPEDPTLSGHQASPIFRPTPSHRVSRLSSSFLPKLLRSLRYGAIRIITQTPRDDTVDFLRPQRNWLSMELVVTKTNPNPDNLSAAETCDTSTRRTLQRSEPPSPSPSLKRKPALSTGTMAHAITIQRRLSRPGGIRPRRQNPSGRSPQGVSL